MGEARRKFDKDFREGAVRLVRETGKPIAQVARDLGINEGTLGNWVNADRRRRDGGDGALSGDERAELVRLRRAAAPPLIPRTLPRCGRGARRDQGTGPPLRPSRLLRTALRTAALRAGPDPGDHCGPAGGRYGQAPACPSRSAARPRAAP